MALFSCNECGGKVSDNASKCPHCGAGQLKSVGVSGGQRLLGVILVILGSGLTIFIFDSKYASGGMTTIPIILIVLGIIIMFSPEKNKNQRNDE